MLNGITFHKNMICNRNVIYLPFYRGDKIELLSRLNILHENCILEWQVLFSIYIK